MSSVLLILASTSPTRRSLLTHAGVAFQYMAPLIDEEKLQQQMASEHVNDLARKLAAAKSQSLAKTHPSEIIIGADQTLLLDGELLHKPKNVAEAKAQLIKLRGKTHSLNSAICCSKNGKILWEHEDQAKLTMRNFSDSFLNHYLERSKDDIFTSVGSYKLEGLGIQLLREVTGDYFTILGFPILPLLEFLRSRDIIPS